MPVIELDKIYKIFCKYCGKSKKSKDSENFVCNYCKKFCKQSLSEEELIERDFEILHKMNVSFIIFTISENLFLDRLHKILKSDADFHLSNEQYLSAKRILTKGIPL